MLNDITGKAWLHCGSVKRMSLFFLFFSVSVPERNVLHIGSIFKTQFLNHY